MVNPSIMRDADDTRVLISILENKEEVQGSWHDLSDDAQDDTMRYEGVDRTAWFR
jgi:hypothetical protein